MAAMDHHTSKYGITRNVFVMGLVSFFNDVASEMVYPIIPIFLTAFLGTSVALVGVIEGIAESTSSILKVISGWLSDRSQKRKPFVIAGYAFSVLSKLLLAAAYTWHFVLAARFVDRFGKGTRTSARDALITESTTENNRGKAFGFHRALDTLGAVVGPLLALLLLSLTANNMRLIFFIAFFPGLIGLLLLVIFVREARVIKLDNNAVTLKYADLGFSFKLFLFISIIFAIGNSSDAFLILRAQNLGLSVILTVFAYVIFNLAYAVFSFPAGIISDKIGPRIVIAGGFFIFAIVYLLFGLINHSMYLWILFPIYGLYMALTEGIGKAYISCLIPSEKSGSAFGIYQTTIGFCAFFASFFAGLLWTQVNSRAPFIFGCITAVVSAMIFLIFEKRTRIINSNQV